MKLKLSDIKIGERQRLDMGDITELADSLTRLGQIHNIGVRAEDNQLVWGMRRYLAAKSLGWEEIEATVRSGLTPDIEQEIELEEDIKRKDRTWQERCLATAKLFRIKQVEAAKRGEPWNIRLMASYIGVSKATVADYVYKIAAGLSTEPRDEQLWTSASYFDALQILRSRAEKEALDEIERRRAANQTVKALVQKMVEAAPQSALAKASLASHVQALDTTPLKPLSLRDRAMLYNTAFEHLGPPNTPLYYSNKNNREFITAFWFVSGGNISDLYGSYQIEYLKRITTLFPDKKKVVHLFVGSLPPSDSYVRVGLPQDGSKPDIECDVHELSSHLPFKADLIYADPPYSVEDSEHYDNAMINRERVMSECAAVLAEDGYLVWLDQALPIFSSNALTFVGAIGYIRSTGNRFRVVSIFRKTNQCPPTTSTPNPAT